MTATIACVNVGQGDATVAVEHGTGAAVLIDCREGHHDSVAEELRKLGATEVVLALVTHSHMDHFGGVLDVLEDLGDRFTGTLYFNHDTLMAVPVQGEDRAVAGRRLRALLIRAREFGARGRRLEISPEIGELGGQVGDLSWRLLAPNFEEVAQAVAVGNPNLASGVVVLSLGADNVVVGADAVKPTWDRICGDVPKRAIVRWPHHGGALSSDPDAVRELVDLLEPAIVIVSVGASNRHGHPSEEFFAAAGGRPGRLYCTQATPACVAGGGAGGVCAGTIRVIATGDGSPRVVTATPDHPTVVAAFGNGRCTPEARRDDG